MGDGKRRGRRRRGGDGRGWEKEKGRWLKRRGKRRRF